MLCTRIAIVATLVWFAGSIVSVAGAQTVIHVDDDAPAGGDGLSWATAYDSLDTALTAAEPGDQIWVAAGTYVGTFTLALEVELYGGFACTETDLTQRDWTANPTILDGNRTGSVVTSPEGATETTRIDGFTITNGSASDGGGVYLEYCSPTIANNTITGNRAFYYGGGMSLDSSSPTIANNTITGNRAGFGGGLSLYDSSSPTIANNTITKNVAVIGGGLYLRESFPTIVNNTITGNSADDDGGGLYLYNSSATVANNTITGNNASSGGGLYLVYFSSPKIANTIVGFNSSGVYRYDTSSTPTLRHNCVYGNTEYDYDGLADPTGTDGNISADPLFVQTPDAGPDGEWATDDDHLGDQHLSSGSPSIDAGDNAAVPMDVLTDLDGRPRFVNDPAVPDTGYGTRPIVDMGAYERQAVLLDIHPGQCPNRLNIRSNARVQMAVVGTDGFDVTQIDTDSLVLERADGLGGSLTPWDQGHGNAISVTDAATPFHGDLCDCQSDRRDGIDDLVLRFPTRDIVRELELRGIGPKTPVMLTVRGQLIDGTPFDASDCILTIGGRPSAPGRLSSQDGKD